MNNEQEKKSTNCNCNNNCECENTNESCNCDSNCDCDDSCECGCKDDKEKKSKHHSKHKSKSDELLIEANNKIKELEEKLTRASADMINYRKRKEEEVSRMLKFCNEDLIKALLPTIDNFERAIKLDDDNLEDEVSKFLEGFKMIYCNMQGTMENFDVKAIDGANKLFDPNYHNAIMVEHKDGVEPGMVIEVLQKGYIYKDKVIRPAMVKVSE